MIVSEIMTTDVATITSQSDLGRAIHLMLERDCGFLPVVDVSGKTVGVITDRDVAVAAAAHRRTLAHIGVEEAMSHPIASCRPQDTVITALGTMSQRRVRRLTVVDARGRLKGVLALNDIVLAPRRPGAPTSDEIVETLKTICRHPSLEPVRA